MNRRVKSGCDRKPHQDGSDGALIYFSICLYLVLEKSKCLLALRHLAQILIRPPVGSVAHWRLGRLVVLPIGLNLVARMRLE